MSKESLQVKKIVLEASAAKTPITKENAQLNRSNILTDMKSYVKKLESLRSGGTNKIPVDIDFPSFAKDVWGFGVSDNGSPDAFYAALGINPSNHTMESLFTMNDDINDGFRWLVPEVIREAIRLGLRRGPIYQSLIAADQLVSQPTITLPKIDKSSATPKKTGEAESIRMGTMSFGQRNVGLHKVSTGISITDEVRMYVPLNLLSMHLQDVGINLGLAMDTLAIETLINGDQSDTSMSTAEIGVATTSQFGYRDFLHPWFRLGRLGRMPNVILAGETAGIDIAEIDEFKRLNAGNANLQNINISTPIPQSQNLHIHGAIPANKFMLINSQAALIKLTSMALKMESERIATKQLDNTVVSTTTGFANLFRDGRIMVNNGITFAGNGFPTWMDIDNAENLSI